MKRRTKTARAIPRVAPRVGPRQTGRTLAGAKAGPVTFRPDAETRLRRRLVLVALGRAPADLIVRGARVLSVFSLTWAEDQDIVIAGGRIAWVGPRGAWPGPAGAPVHEATGLSAVPGFGETHKHIESTHLSPEYEAALVIPLGNTWTVECSHEFANVSSARNVEFWLEARRRGSPLKIFPVLASACPPTAVETSGGRYDYAAVRADHAAAPEVAGLDEVMDWPAVWDPTHPGHERIWGVMQATREARGVIEGHGTALRDLPTINAFAAAGLSSDHEGRMAEEIFEKHQRGIFIQLKKEFVEVGVKELVRRGLRDWSNVGLCTDDRDAEETLRLGAMDTHIRHAIAAGAPVEAAFAMASYYPARHHHLDPLVGSIAPGRWADLVLLEGDPAQVRIREVFADGRLAARAGTYLLPVPKIRWPAWATRTVRLKRRVTAADFAIRAPRGRTTVQAAVQRDMYREPGIASVELPVQDGWVQSDPARDIIKVATVERHRRTGGIGKMFWTGMGPKSPHSALAVSVSHDAHHLTVVGTSDAAMALAINTLARQQGGWVLVNRGRVTATVRFEIAGLMTARAAAELAADLRTLHEAARELDWIGAPGIPRRLAFALITCTPNTWRLVLPYRGNPTGLYNLVTRESHPIVW
jgi:adenine deaminase